MSDDVSRTEPRPRIALVVRRDYLLKGGGDVVQAERYVRELRKLGILAELITPAQLAQRHDIDVVHLLNVDLPFEFLEAKDASGDIPVIVSTIHHDSRYLDRMFLASPNGGLDGFIKRLPRELREFLAACRRLFLDRESGTAAIKTFVKFAIWLPGLKRRVGSTLKGCAGVLVLSEKERLALERDFGIRLPGARVISNGLEDRRKKVADEKSRSCVVVGRVEPRKRQLEILMNADRLGLPVTFIGALNQNHPRYALEFETKVRTSRTCEWLGPLDHAQVLQEMSAASVLLNLSWVEVQSLVELEGLVCGCWEVVGDSGPNQDFFPDRVFAYDPESIDQALTQVSRLLGEDSGGRPPEVHAEYPGYPSWADVGRELLDVYRSAMHGSR